MTLLVDLRLNAVGGDCATEPTYWDGAILITAATFALRCAGSEVLFIIHGFNVNRSSGVSHATNMEQALGFGATAVVVGVLWPGDSSWAPVVDYPFEGNVANQSGGMLADIIDGTLQSAASISIASHSLGARVALQCISEVSAPIARLYLLAGAIENDCLVNEFRAAAVKIPKISVLSSHADTVLEWAFPLGNLLGTVLMHDEPGISVALGRNGPSDATTGVTPGWELPDVWGFVHGSYMPDLIPQTQFYPPGSIVPPQGTVAPAADTVVDWRAAWVAGLIRARW